MQPARAPISRNETVLFKYTIENNQKLETMNVNDVHHRWVHHGDEDPRNMVKLKGFRLVGKLKPCDACGLINAKAKPISTMHDPSKKSSDFGERFFVDTAGTFPLTVTRWHKATRNKLL